MINWKVRLGNKNFWLAIIPAILVLAKEVLELFGITYDFGDLGNKLVGIVETVFLILSILGVVNDPTTDGFKDSVRAMTYETPYKD